MARPKTGFDFIPTPTDIMNAPKIRRLKRRAPLVGWAVYTALYYKILRYKGYYIEITDDIVLDVAEEHGIEEAEVLKGIEACVSVGLFDNSKYDKYQVLTSAEIQQSVTDISAKCNRVAPKFLSHLCLIANNSSEECADSSEFVTQNKIKIKEKIKQNKVDDNSAHTREATATGEGLKNNIDNKNIEIDELCAQMQAESEWVDELCGKYATERAYLLRRIAEFCQHLKEQKGIKWKQLGDAKRHFADWLPKREQGEAQVKQGGPTAAPTKGWPKFYVYEEMLTEAYRRGTTTDAFAPIRIDGQEKPMWVSVADKRTYNIPDKIAGTPQISTITA